MIVHKRGFTLVELIIVVVILAILGTIALISFQGLTSSARNGKRKAELLNVETSIELFLMNRGFYPDPTSGVAITYSGGTIWTQGSFGKSMLQNVGRINEVPKDPITGNEFTYSVTVLRQEYQLGSMIEKGNGFTENIIPQTYANNKKGKAYITGNYNEKFTKVSTGGVDYVLALPSIIASDISSRDIISILNKKALCFNEYENIPASYKGLGYAMTGSFDFIPSNPVIFSGSILNLVQDTNQLIFASRIKNIYANSILNGKGNYSEIVLIDTVNKPTDAKKVVINYLRNKMGSIYLPNLKLLSTPRINWFNYTKTTESSITANTLYATFKDISGDIWVGSWGGGVSRYDGNNWVTYTTSEGLANNIVYSISQDTSGNMWFGTSAGASRLVLTGSVWTTFTSANTSSGLGSNIINMVHGDKLGNVWFATSGGATKFNGTTWTKYLTTQGLASNTVYSVSNTPNNDIWFGTSAGANRLILTGSVWTTFNTTNTTSLLAHNTVRHIKSDTLGNIWFATASGLSRYNGTTWNRYTNVQGLINNSTYYINIDTSNNIWIATSGGVSKFTGSSWTNFTTTQGLIRNDVRGISIDNNGSLWFVTWGGGVSSYNGTNWVSYQKSPGLTDNLITSIAGNNNNLWIATNYGGVNNFTNETNWVNHGFLTAGLGNNTILGVYKDFSGNIWAGTNGNGVSRYNGTSWTNFTTTNTANLLGHNSVKSIFQDTSGNMWFATSGGGVSRYNGTSWTKYTTTNGLVGNTVTSITQGSDGNMWFGTSVGISRFNGTSWINYTTTNTPLLANNSITTLYKDLTGEIWVGTLSGMNRFNGSVWKKYTTTQGLPHNNVRTFTQGTKDILWIGTGNGISKMGTKTDIFFNINTSGGIINNLVNTLLIEGVNLWLGTDGGISKGVLDSIN